MDTARLLAAALDTAAHGWPVFPLLPNRKQPALHSEKRCPRTGACAGGHLGWEQRATTNPDRIRACWGAGAYNIGVPTGPAGLLVVDLDMPKSPGQGLTTGWTREGVADGQDVFALVCQRAGQPVPADTFTVATPSGGLHLYFRMPAELRLRNTSGEAGAGLGPLIDTRGWGGYVVAPGSITPEGIYRPVCDSPVAELPGWLGQALTPKPRTATSAAPQMASTRLPAYVEAAVQGERSRVAASQPTRHHKDLFAAGVALGQLEGAGLLPPGTALAELLDAARHIVTGDCRCTAAEVKRHLENGIDLGKTEPRVRPEQPPAPTGELFPAPQRGAA